MATRFTFSALIVFVLWLSNFHGCVGIDDAIQVISLMDQPDTVVVDKRKQHHQAMRLFGDRHVQAETVTLSFSTRTLIVIWICFTFTSIVQILLFCWCQNYVSTKGTNKMQRKGNGKQEYADDSVSDETEEDESDSSETTEEPLSDL